MQNEAGGGPDASRSVAGLRRFVVPAAAVGTRLDVFLARSLEVSRAQARRVLERGAVRLGGRLPGEGERRLGERDKGLALSAGDAVVVEAFRPPACWSPLPEPAGGAPAPAVLAEGPGWLVVDKPAGMPVHPLVDGETGTVLNAVVAMHPEVVGVGVGVGEGGLRCGVVHRLDVWTSGALVIATDAAVWQRLRAAFAEHRVAKRYLALVEGHFAPGAGGPFRMELGLVMARHRPAKVRVARSDEAGGPSVRPISQTVRLLESYGDASLVEVVPKTGFLHQIRVTLAHLGHPIVGDRTYAARRRGALTESRGALTGRRGALTESRGALTGSRGASDESRGASAESLAERCGARRHMLHAAEVEVDEVHAVAPIAADFARCRAWLSEHASERAAPATVPSPAEAEGEA